MTMAAPRDSQAGVTLIEMLVSLVIFAFVGLASFTLLQTLLQVQTRTDGRLENLAQLDRALSVFTRDAMQSDPSNLRLEAGALSGQISPGRIFTYGDGDAALVRRISTSRVETNDLVQVLAPEVQAIRLVVLDHANRWHETWPVDDDLRARAIKLDITFADGRAVTRLVPLADRHLE